MTTYFKAVRPDGTDFCTGTVQWAPPDGHACKDSIFSATYEPADEPRGES